MFSYLNPTGAGRVVRGELSVSDGEIGANVTEGMSKGESAEALAHSMVPWFRRLVGVAALRERGRGCLSPPSLARANAAGSARLVRVFRNAPRFGGNQITGLGEQSPSSSPGGMSTPRFPSPAPCRSYSPCAWPNGQPE